MANGKGMCLDPATRTAIEAADTLFVASTGGGKGVDVSHRAGRPGFVKIDGNTLTISDYAGNRYFNTLGNLLLDPRPALLFPDFTNGDCRWCKVAPKSSGSRHRKRVSMEPSACGG